MTSIPAQPDPGKGSPVPEASTASATPTVCLVVALPAEARPLVDFFELDSFELGGSRSTGPTTFYRNARLALAVSGVGRYAAAAAVGELFALNSGARQRAWLNVGIGGHASWDLGTAGLANRIVEGDGARTYYPQRIFESPCPGATVRTVDRPETEFPDAAIYEMEASGFWGAAARYSSAEFVHCLKIVSDNAQSTRPPKAQDARNLIATRMPMIETVVAALDAQVREWDLAQAPTVSTAPYVERWHFTTAQQRLLAAALRRWTVLHPDQSPFAEFEAAGSAKQVLQRFDQLLAQQELRVQP